MAVLTKFSTLVVLWTTWIVAHGTYPFTSWTPSGDTLPESNRHMYCVYEEDFNADCIWLLGGYRCQSCVYCYNITSDSIYSYDTLDNTAWNWGVTAGVIINGTVYYWVSGDIRKYDIAAKEESTLRTFVSPTYSDRACLRMNPNVDNYNQLLIVDGKSSSNFYIYDIDTNGITWGDSLDVSRSAPECIVSYSKYDNSNYDVTEAYYYVIGGDTTVVERIDVTGDVSLASWETVFNISDTINGSTWDFTGSNKFWVATSYYNWIYIFSGYNINSGSEDDTFYLDTSRNESNMDFVYCNVDGCDYPELIVRPACTLVTSNQRQETRIYCFGGLINAVGESDSIYISNNAYHYTNDYIIANSINVTYPSNQPSNQPSQEPSSIPSIEPSNEPSYDPSNEPTNVQPAIQPTNQPTNQPSDDEWMSTTQSQLMSTMSTYTTTDNNVLTSTMKSMSSSSTASTTSSGGEVTGVTLTGEGGANNTDNNDDQNTDENANFPLSDTTMIIIAVLLCLGLLCAYGLRLWYKLKTTAYINDHMRAAANAQPNLEKVGSSSQMQVEFENVVNIKIPAKIEHPSTSTVQLGETNANNESADDTDDDHDEDHGDHDVDDADEELYADPTAGADAANTQGETVRE